MMGIFSQGQVMLSLALLSYRSFWETDAIGADHLGDAIAAGLDDLEPLGGDWQLVWGPGTYRHLGSLFDSSMMFVVGHRKQEGRYIIVIRGTNPVSMFDWIFGDFLPHRQVPWFPAAKVGDVAPAISLSAALGLKSLLEMRGGAVTVRDAGPGPDHSLLDLVAQLFSGVQGAGGAVLSTVKKIGKIPELSMTLEEMARLAARLNDYQQRWSQVMGVPGKAVAAAGDWLDPDELLGLVALRRGLVKLLDESLDTVAEAPVAILMPPQTKLQQGEGGGTTLLALLRHLVEVHGDSLRLGVTGHSKGGMLAPVLAQFLFDTQGGRVVSAEYSWNPAGTTPIHCYAFAGSTPGNSSFAEHFNMSLGPNFYRYANKLDATTLLWQSERMRDMPSLLGERGSGLSSMDLLAKQMADEVAHLDYAHPGLDYPLDGGVKNVMDRHVVEFSGRPPSQQSSYPLEVIYQHMGAYMDLLGLDRFFDLPLLMGVGSKS